MAPFLRRYSLFWVWLQSLSFGHLSPKTTGRYNEGWEDQQNGVLWSRLAGSCYHQQPAGLLICTLIHCALGHLQDYINVSGRQYMQRWLAKWTAFCYRTCVVLEPGKKKCSGRRLDDLTQRLAFWDVYSMSELSRRFAIVWIQYPLHRPWRYEGRLTTLFGLPLL